MRFIPLALQGAYRVDLEHREDQRGFFARAFCRHEFEERALESNFVQCNLSFNHRRGTLRGMHYQVAPHQEAKLVRCLRGAIYDVIVDLRPESPTFKRWLGVQLDEENRAMLYVPEGFAHSYITLADNSEVFYQVSEFYHPESERGVRWDDPTFSINWPVSPSTISDKDRSYENFCTSMVSL